MVMNIGAQTNERTNAFLTLMTDATDADDRICTRVDGLSSELIMFLVDTHRINAIDIVRIAALSLKDTIAYLRTVTSMKSPEGI